VADDWVSVNVGQTLHCVVGLLTRFHFEILENEMTVLAGLLHSGKDF